MSLLHTLQVLLERTYRMRSGLDEIGGFVIGDRGYVRLYGSSEQITSAGAIDADGARTMVRETERGVRACIYYPDVVIRRLEAFPPQDGLGEENVDAFGALVEELDHLLLIAERTREGRTVSLFELELHANVSKHLVLTRFLAGLRGRLDEGRRLWLRHHLFEKVVYCDPDPAVRARYRDAARWAVRFLDAIRPRSAPRRLAALREFHALSLQGKLEWIDRLAA